MPVTLSGEEYADMMGVLFASQYLSGRESYLRLGKWEDEISNVLGQNGFSQDESDRLCTRFRQKTEQVREQTSRWRQQFFQALEIEPNEGTETTSVRMLAQDNQIIDLLVDLGFQNSRSDAIAYFAHKGLEYNRYWLWLHREDMARAVKSHNQIADEIKGRGEIPVNCPKCGKILGMYNDYAVWRSGGIESKEIVCPDCRSEWSYEVDVRGTVDINPASSGD